MTTVLVANRGEIALRVVTACRKVGFAAVVAASEADLDSAAARAADRVVCIGPPDPARSYLRPDLLAQAALGVGADVVHPGYGFCSEKPELGELLAKEGIALAGPRPETLRAVGDKTAARAVAVAAGVPVAPGAAVADAGEAAEAAPSVGFPLLLKAVHGGGGRGIHLVESSSVLRERFGIAAAEARVGSGDGALYLERFYAAARHVEVQIFGDGAGRVQVLGDRDCSVQRRHQKLVEECPAPGLPAGTRAGLHDAARRIGERLAYTGAGTVEFLVEVGSGDSAPFVFLEVNGRIQVEHPVTEEAYGVDLVAAQLRLAAGLPAGLPDVPPVPAGHVIECRVTAEDPHRGFRPSPGTITRARFPSGPGIRVDTHVHDGHVFPPYYDSLLAKLVVRAHDRAAAVAAMRAALDDVVVEGVATSTDVHRAVLGHPDFRAGGVTTGWLDGVWPPHEATR